MEFEACVRQKINVIVGVIGNDAGWTQIRRGQVQLYGSGTLGRRTALAFTRYDKVVEALGGHGGVRRTAQDIRPGDGAGAGGWQAGAGEHQDRRQRFPKGRHLDLSKSSWRATRRRG